MATVASGTLCCSYSGGAGGYIDYSFTDGGTFSVIFRNSSSKTWEPSYGTYFGIIVEYNGTMEDITATSGASSYAKTASFTYKRSCNSLTIYCSGWSGSSYVPTGLVDTYFEQYPEGPIGYTVSWTVSNTAPTVSFNTLPTLYAGQAATISFTGSDAEGDYYIYYYLTRYYKAPGSSSYSSTYVGSTYKKSSGSASITDNIPSNYVGYSIYYKLEAEDDLDASTTITSSTVTVQKANTAPTGTVSLSSSVLYGNIPVTISWTLSDADGNTVTTTRLRRWVIKPDGSESATTLTTSNVNSYTDTIPKDLIDSYVEYEVSFTDGTASNNAWSNGYTVENCPPTARFNTLPTLYAGKTATISWTASDYDGDTVTTTKLIRYYKASGASSESSITLISSSTSSTSYTDTIPNIVGGTVYYSILVSDGKRTTMVDSLNVTVQKPPCNVKVIINGVITEASGVATIQSGVITDMDGELHTVISGVIT